MASIAFDLGDIDFVGRGLQRPECVLCTASGDVFTADWRGGIVRVGADGTQRLFIGQMTPEKPPLQPNGIALEPDGTFLLADISTARAGVWRMDSSGAVSPFLLELEGTPLPPVNFVYRDQLNRVWITVSTRLRPRARDYRPEASSGFIVLVDDQGARIAADGLGYTNECRVDPTGEWLYVNETFGRRLTRFRIGPEGALGRKETVVTFGQGTFPDGLAFDTEGGIWVTSIVSNRLIRIDRSGEQHVLLEDSEPDHVAWVESAFLTGTMDRPHLDTVRSQALKSISSIAFGGPDLKTVYLGCLLGDRLARFRSPIAGVPPVHWTYTM